MSDRIIFKQGFPAGTPESDAAEAAVAGCENACAEAGFEMVGGPLSVDVVRTPEHEAAGEYLVKVVANRRPVGG